MDSGGGSTLAIDGGAMGDLAGEGEHDDTVGKI
jgi:hypothetical protein